MKIKVKVFPGSGREEIEEISRDDYKVYLKKKAEDGKANIELCKILKKHFGREVRIISGMTSRKKIIEVYDKNI